MGAWAVGGGGGWVEETIRPITWVLSHTQLKITSNNQRKANISSYFLVSKHFLQTTARRPINPSRTIFYYCIAFSNM